MQYKQEKTAKALLININGAYLFLKQQAAIEKLEQEDKKKLSHRLLRP